MKSPLLALIATAVLFPDNGLAGEFARDIPQDTWEPIFFQSINALTTKAGLKPLRAEPVPPDSIELRIWMGFGLSPLQGFAFRRDGSNWIGRVVSDNLATKTVDSWQVTPRCGWDNFWHQLVALEVLTLPDSSTLPNEVMVMDGTSYVVEINHDNRYRTYMYGNPKVQQWPEAEKIIRIIDVLHKEL
jgi:hypothetical protein